MNVAIVGGSGMVGRALTRSLLADGHEVLVLSRDPRRRARSIPAGARIARWSDDDVEDLAGSIEGMDALVSVAGARVAPWPWTRRRKELIASSRVGTVRAIVAAMERLPVTRRPARLVVVSGIDAYPESGHGAGLAAMTETDPLGSEFLAQVSRSIEDEARRAEALGVQVTRLRMGHVLARDADLVWFLSLPVRLFLGGRIGSGEQWMSWVHIDDAVALFRRALGEGVPGGVLNVTSPGACRQVEFVAAMARVLHRPARFTAPAGLVRLVLGEQSVLLLGSRRVGPAVAAELGYTFRYPAIDGALEQALG